MKLSNMKMYQNKPVKVMAVQYQPGMEDGFACYEITGQFLGFFYKNQPIPRAVQKPAIITKNTWIFVTTNDYIVVMENGDKYVCKKDIFESEYEEINN